jgi:two-component system, cell cycle sensor histidine kinase and response regulator CckA
VLTDVVMPEMSGPELAARLKALSPGVRLMYMSGYADDVVSRHGVLDTVTAFIPKPFTLDLLARKVRFVLDRKNPQ